MRLDRTPNFNVADSVTWAKGRHVMKMGGELRTYSNYNEQVATTISATSRSTVRSPETRTPTFCWDCPGPARRLDPLVNRQQSSKELGLFVTDTFKVTPKLTLDIGLRWDRFSATTYDDGLMFNWDPTTGNVIVPQEALDKISPAVSQQHQRSSPVTWCRIRTARTSCRASVSPIA